MGISMSLDLNTATLAELAALVNAAKAAGVQGETPVNVAGSVLSFEVDDISAIAAEEVIDAEPVSASGGDMLRDSVRQVLNEEAVRSVLDTLISKGSQRRP